MKKGFTLIELLAVVVILAIIALIAAPTILNIILSSYDSSDESSIELYAKAVENAIAKYYLNNPNNPAGSYDYSEESQTLTNKTDSNIKLEVEYDGAKVQCTTIEIYEDGNIFLNNCKVDNRDVNYLYGSERITVTSTQNYIVIETNKKSTLKNYRIYGSSEGVGDSSGNVYVIPVTVSGKNKVKFDANYNNLQNSTLIETLDNGVIVQGKGTSGNNQWANGWYGVAYQNYKTNGIYLEAGEKVTISADYTWLDITNLKSNTRGIYLYGTENLTNYITSKIEANVLKRETTTYTVNTSGYYYLLFTLNSSKVKIENIQVSTLSDITYEPYVEPTTFNITLTSPLMEGEYIDFETQKVVRNNGTTESINIPVIKTLSVPTTIIEVDTTNKSSSIEATYIR